MNSKSESKLCYYNKILKRINIKFYITIPIIIIILYICYYLYKYTNHNVFVTIYLCIREEIRILIFMLFP